MLRMFASIILLFSVLFMPFWVSVILALVGMIYFSYFVEAVFMFLLSDLLFGVPEVKFLNAVFISFFLKIFCLIVVELLKKTFRFTLK